MMKYLLYITTVIPLLLPTTQVTAQENQRTQAVYENCYDGVDNNNNGKIDCADLDPIYGCAFDNQCKSENANFNCADGIDNDKDGDIDCADSECDCTGVEICNNLLDDDGDGLVDCADTVGVGSNCKDFVGCERECNNGVDDDGDGFFDYYDGDCVDHPDNPNTYIVTKPDCEARPQGNIFDVNEAWRSGRNTVNNRGIPIVADVDNDGTPEVIVLDENKVRILSGKDGTVEATFSFPNGTSNDAMEALAIADVDNDGYGEFFGLNKNGWLRRLDYTPGGIVQTWSHDTGDKMVFVGLADFNQDGTVEVYYGNEIRDAVTGNLLVAGSNGKNTYPAFGDNNWQSELNNSAVAVDILPASECTTCNGLELVLGHVIYAVDLTGGKLTEVKNMNDVNVVPETNKTGFTGKYYTYNNRNQYTAVVDYNQDGFLDVLMSGSVDKRKGPTAVFFWDVHNKAASAFVVTRPSNTISDKIPRPNGGTMDFRNQYNNVLGGDCNADGQDCYWEKGTGSLNVANIDSDPALECTFMSGSSLYAIDVNMKPEWDKNFFVATTDPAYGSPTNGNHVNFWESTSGFTGTAVFDFDGDGASEVIYRDQVDLYVVDGETGRVLNSQYANLTKCSSNTGYEYPIIADVDGDGETEIIVSCSRLENDKYQGPNTGGGTDGHIRVYKASPDMFWVPARQIWNQFNYFNVNINDNLTVPRFQQPHHLNFSQICIDPDAPNNFSLNKFLNQSPRITFCGDLAFPAAKLDFPDDAVTITPPICPEDTFRVTLKFQNTGDYAVLQPIPFAFYAQDPTQKHLNSVPNPWLDTVYVDVPGGVQPGQQVDTTVTVHGARGEFDLFVSMNDIGPFDKDTKNALANEDFYALTALNGTVRECDATPSIVSKSVKAVPFLIQATAYDNRRCSDVIGINNGQIQITDEDGKPFTPLSNYALTLVNTRTADTLDLSGSRADLDSGTFIMGLDSGTYALSVSYTNDAYSCGSVTDTLRINRVEGWPGNEQLKITKIKDVSSCKPGTADGAAQVQVYLGDSLMDINNYEVVWRDEQNGEEILGDSVVNLKPVTYDITVTNITTGCSLGDSSLVMDLPLPQLGDPVVTPVTNCRTPDGSVTAVMQAGDIADYEFYLIEEFDAQDTLESTTGVFTNLREGLYELKAYDPNNDCGLYSDGKAVEIINSAVLPELTLTQVSPQTACDPTKANGHLRVAPGTPGDYTYTWFKGTVTTGSTAEVVGNAADATGLYTYNNPRQLFTVVVEDNNTGCTTSDTISLKEQIAYPVPQATATARTYCATLNGTISANVGGNTADYTFELYQGTTATGTAMATSSDGAFTGLDSVEYTIVAIETATGCATPAPLAYTIEVPGNTKAPVVLPTVVDQSSCDPTDPNGTISLSVDGAAATTSGYTYEWRYEGGTTTSAVTTITGLERGNYQLTVTNSTTGCDTTLVLFVDDKIYEGDDLNLVLDVDNVSNCNPFNGRIEVTEVIVDGISTPASDYTFTWYQIETIGLDSTLLAGDGPVISGLEVGQYSVQAFRTLTGCRSSYQMRTVDNDAIEPTISVIPSKFMTDCINPDGEFGVEAVDPTGTVAIDDYIYHWYLGADTSGVRIHTGRVISDVRASVFTIVVVDPNTGCKTVKTDDLAANGNLLPVFTSDPMATDIVTCPGTGSVETEVDLSVGAGSAQSDYVFYWFEGKSAPQSTKPGARPGDVDTLQAVVSGMYGRGDAGRIQTNLSAGFYTVLAVYPPDGCQSIPKFVEVKQIARKPSIRLISSRPDSLCNTLTGELQIAASKGTDDTTPLTSYTYVWNDDNTINSDTRTNLATGSYTVTVTDDQTGCSDVRTYTVRDRQVKPVVATSSIAGNNLCQPVYAGNGIITVEQIVSGPSIVSSTATFENDYHFYLYDDESDFVAATPAANVLKDQPAGANNYIFTDLAPGTYYVAVANNTNGCVSPFLHDVIVPDNTPVMTFSLKEQEMFVECTGLNEGRLRVEVQNATGPFTFTWYNGNSTSNPVITTDITNAGRSSTIENLKGGEYTLQVVDQNNQACTISQFFTVPVEQVRPILVNESSDQTNCNLPDGSIEVTGIILDGNTENLSDYTYTWYQGSLDPADATRFENTFGQGGTAYNNLPAGTYFIIATANFADGCPTDPVQVIITDEDVEDLEVERDFISEPILGCDPSQFEEGGIDIKVPNSNNFTTEWFRGNQVDIAQHIAFRIDENGNNIPLDNATSIGGSTNGNLLVAGDTLTALPPGVYTVRVTDNNNIMCPAVRRYTIQGIAVPLEAFPSAKPQTSCLVDNGAVALTINGGKGNYQVNWYAGPSATGTPINANNAYRVDDLPAGPYTVTVSDDDDPSCGTVTRQITVEDRRGNDLQITVNPDFPMTNCDDANPNGQLSAKIDRPLTRYEFFWYEGTNTAANPIAFGPTVTNLGENTYSVIARDRITGCLSDPFTGEIITLLDSGLMPAPTVRMLSPVTRCSNPDGSAQATLDSMLTVDPNIDYEYIWRDAQGKVILSTSRTDQITQLDTGRYQVVVRNTITGCLSLPGEVQIGLQLKEPEFEIVTTVSSCDEPSGTLSLNLFEVLEVVNIAWVTPYGEANGFFLDEQPAGTYTATLTDASGCQYTREAVVLPNIEIYNAVSPNGDQKNDIFTVSCIEAYENNIVRIYNRAGSLVYQHRGYDNQTVFFDGFGNHGVYVGKKELPDGTYFYIVDKQNGDQPLSGYLELLR